MIIYPDRKDKGTIVCSICSSSIEEFTYIYQPGLYSGIVCEECCDMFSEEDRELIINIFMAYGGYYGKEKGKTLDIGSLLKDTLEIIEKRGKTDVKEIQVILLHKALLHGYTPQEFSIKLKEFLKT